MNHEILQQELLIVKGKNFNNWRTVGSAVAMAFRSTINKDKIHVHTYSNGTTVEGGNHDQSNSSWGPNYGNQNIPYLRIPGYRTRYTYPT